MLHLLYIISYVVSTRMYQRIFMKNRCTRCVTNAQINQGEAKSLLLMFVICSLNLIYKILGKDELTGFWPNFAATSASFAGNRRKVLATPSRFRFEWVFPIYFTSASNDLENLSNFGLKYSFNRTFLEMNSWRYTSTYFLHAWGSSMPGLAIS